MAAGIRALRRQLTAYPMPVPGGRLVEEGAFDLVPVPEMVVSAVGWNLLTASPAAMAAALAPCLAPQVPPRGGVAAIERFKGYPAYRRRTRRLIPWLY